jgi:stage III sporulation protein AB
MIQWIGATLILCGSLAWGLSAVLRLRRRVAVLDSLCTALSTMRMEICDRMAPMPEIFKRLSAELPYPVSALFENLDRNMEHLGQYSFAEIWRASIEETDGLLLTPQEEFSLSELGLSLGKYRVEEQSAAIVCTLRRMERYADQAHADQKRDGRLHACLGVAAGIFAVILLV